MKQKKRILLVDDEPLILYGLSKTLVDLGDIKTVKTGEEACDEIDKSHYDICFLDVFLPGKNGLEVMGEIHQKSPDTKVIIMSAYADDQTKDSLKDKAFLFLEKPFNLSEVKELIRKELD